MVRGSWAIFWSFRCPRRVGKILPAAAPACLSRAGAACVAVFLFSIPGGCSMSFPISPLLMSGSKDDAVGEAAKAPLGVLLDAEDWRRARAALSAALDPQGDGSLVGWDNPASGNKGSFVPVGKAYPLDARVCRVFLAKVDHKGGEQAMQGTACANKPGEWAIAEAKPWKQT